MKVCHKLKDREGLKKLLMQKYNLTWNVAKQILRERQDESLKLTT